MPHKTKRARRAYYKRYQKENPDKIRNKNLLKTHGISLAEYNSMLDSQGGTCAICMNPERVIHPLSKKLQPLAVDHDHQNNLIRGLLCGKCNTALGLLDDSKERAWALIQYLERYEDG